MVGRRFSYFGENAGPALAEIDVKPPARFTRVNFTEREKEALLGLLKGLPRGVRGKPWGWKKDDGSWKPMRAECG